jgi:hypothetical protein
MTGQVLLAPVVVLMRLEGRIINLNWGKESRPLVLTAMQLWSSCVRTRFQPVPGPKSDLRKYRSLAFQERYIVRLEAGVPWCTFDDISIN